MLNNMEAIEKADRILYLCHKKVAGNLDKQEAQELDEFLTHSEENASVWKEIDTFEAKNYSKAPDSERVWDTLKKRLFPGIYSDNKSSGTSGLRMAAAIVLIIGASVIGYLSLFRDSPPDTAQTQFEVRPGTNQPALILADGYQINLDSITVGSSIRQQGNEVFKKGPQELVYSSSSEQSSVNDTHTLFVPRGRTYQVTLPDGSVIWINAGSTVRYPLWFADTNRVISLSGEAYFDVKETGRADPFRVKTDYAEVTVLGTRFNINAYSNEPDITTSLLKGELLVNNGRKSVSLHAGQEAKMARSTDSFIVRPVSSDVIRWITGEIKYKGTIEGYLKVIERRFNVKAVYNNLEVRHLQDTLTAYIYPSDSITNIVQGLNYMKLAVTIKGNEMIVKSRRD